MLKNQGFEFSTIFRHEIDFDLLFSKLRLVEFKNLTPTVSGLGIKMIKL